MTAVGAKTAPLIIPRCAIWPRRALGHAGLVEFAQEFNEQQNGNARHWNSNIHITQTADGAAGTCYLMLWNVGVRPAEIIVTGTYHDTLVETSDGWRFKSRRLEADRPPASGQD